MTSTAVTLSSSPAHPDTDAALFLRALDAEARNHRAVRHPLLDLLATCPVDRLRGVYREFATTYDAYSQWFTRYLRAVIQGLESAEHRELLAHNLAEEQGHLHAEDREALEALGIDVTVVDGVPHKVLFRRFCSALGLLERDLAVAPPEALRWRQLFLDLLAGAPAAVGVGALGIGTEGIVSTIYARMLEGIRRIPGLTRNDYVFFELHCEVDDQHQQDLLALALSYAAPDEGRAALRRGVHAALELRAEVFDALHARLSAVREEVA